MDTVWPASLSGAASSNRDGEWIELHQDESEDQRHCAHCAPELPVSDTEPVVKKRSTMLITPLAQSICFALTPISDGSVMLMIASAIVSRLNQNTLLAKIDLVCMSILLFVFLSVRLEQCPGDNA